MTGFRSRRLAITDFETSGVDPRVHEILEIGLIVVEQDSLEVVDTLDMKVKPEHIETASQTALSLNGYDERNWKDAVSLTDAIAVYASKTKYAIFCSHNVTFDWGFATEAFYRTGVMHDMDYHRIDLFTVAWALLRPEGVQDFTLSGIGSHLGVEPEPVPHRAINGASNAYHVLRRLIFGKTSKG